MLSKYYFTQAAAVGSAVGSFYTISYEILISWLRDAQEMLRWLFNCTC